MTRHQQLSRGERSAAENHAHPGHSHHSSEQSLPRTSETLRSGHGPSSHRPRPNRHTCTHAREREAMPRRLGKHACDKGDGMQSPRQANPNPVPAAQTPYVDHMPSQASAGSAVAPRCGPPAQLPRTPPCARRPAPADPLHTRGFPPRWHLRAERPSTAPQASPPACSQSADPLHRPMRQTSVSVTGCNSKDRKPQSRGPLVPPCRVPRSSWSSSADLRAHAPASLLTPWSSPRCRVECHTTGCNSLRTCAYQSR